MPSVRDIIVIHSSDLHIDNDYTARLHGGDGAAGLACVLGMARTLCADVIILAGDTFDNHRVPQALIERAATLLSDSRLPVVVLPGNHDPAVDGALYRGGALAAVKNLHVIGITHDETIVFADLSLEIWGRAHFSYDDMIPLEVTHSRGPQRRTRWQIAVAHGHYEPSPDRDRGPHPSWLIGDAEIAAAGGADYVALGHWNRCVRVGSAAAPAYYSGSPEYAGTVNMVRLSESKGVSVRQVPLDIAREPTF